MSIDDKRILFAHLRANRGQHAPSCTKSWFEEHGLLWKEFLRNGYTVHELRAACLPRVDEELEALIKFVETEGLWDDHTL